MKIVKKVLKIITIAYILVAAIIGSIDIYYMLDATICSLMVKNDLKSKSKDVWEVQEADSLNSDAMTDTSVPKFKD